jgi:hypothetical protein
VFRADAPGCGMSVGRRGVSRRESSCKKTSADPRLVCVRVKHQGSTPLRHVPCKCLYPTVALNDAPMAIDNFHLNASVSFHQA